MKNTLIITLIIILIAGAVYFFYIRPNATEVVNVTEEPDTTEVVTETPDTPTTTETTDEAGPVEVVGTSVDERDITAYHYGSGDTEVLFIGGIHGGYEWNTVLLSYELMDYLEENPDVVPENVTVTVIPVLNPDGLFEVVGTTDRFTRADVPTSEAATVPGRFNANDVDLNRNFDCEWQSSGTWQNRTVSGGARAFSEPESQAIREYINENEPEAAVVFYSAAGGVFASNCLNGVSDETLALTNLYAKASGYRAYESFDFYEITGDMVNWFAKQNIPAISVLLTNHTDIEWDKNKKGIDAVLSHYGN